MIVENKKFDFGNAKGSSSGRSLARVNFINILHATFLLIFWRQKITKPNITREKLLNSLLYEKRARIMSMKLTPENILHQF